MENINNEVSGMDIITGNDYDGCGAWRRWKMIIIVCDNYYYLCHYHHHHHHHNQTIFSFLLDRPAVELSAPNTNSENIGRVYFYHVVCTLLCVLSTEL